MHGINLGNWLVTEEWMDRAIFDRLNVHDELSLAKNKEGLKRLKHHRKQYIQEDDIRWIAENNIKLIRLPVGFWTIESSDIHYVDWLFEMAQKYNLKVLLCLHGAPGSQNGYDHSGQKGEKRWFKDVSFQQRTTNLLVSLASRYNNLSAFWGIELLNEPTLSFRNYWILRKFYIHTYRKLKNILRPGIYTVFSDSYAPFLMMGMLRGSKKHPVAMDIHWYSFASWWPSYRTEDQHMRKIKKRRWTIAIIQLIHPVIIGEWSAILPHEKVSRLHLRENQNKYYKIQKNIYKNALAECYWSYKTSENNTWNFRYITERDK